MSLPPGVVPFNDWTVRGRWWPTSKRKQQSTAMIIHHSVTDPTGKSGLAQIQAVEDVIYGRRRESRFSMVAYSWLIDTDGRVYEGRGVKYRNGANNDTRGTGFTNTNTMSICYAGNYHPGVAGLPTMEPSAQQIAAAGDLIAWLEHAKELVRAYEVLPHRYVHSTACPGDNLAAAVDDIVRSTQPYTDQETDDMIVQLVADPDTQTSMLMWNQEAPDGQTRVHFDVYGTYRPGAGTTIPGAGWIAVDQEKKGNWIKVG